MRIEKFKLKKNKSKIICLTAYSKNFAEEIDKYTDLILVGDSLGSVLYNFNSTRKVTLNMMIEHSKSVRMGITKSLMIVDMPYNTYKNKNQALKNCKKVMKETKCHGVKLEGGKKIKNIVQHLIKNKNKKTKQKIMTKKEVLNFMQTYQRITQNMFKYAPKYASIVIKLNSNHQINSVKYN